MGINWKIVAGQIGQTMADQENEYRKFATDYFVKRYETQSEEKREWQQKTREQKREIDKRVDALRAEGLTEVQIANGLNTYGDNFFAVVAADLKKFKGSSNYTSLLQQDKTGAKYRDEYRKRFDTLLVTEQQRSLEIEPVVQGLLDKFPQSTETPDITQSIFGFDYTKGIRDDIKGLSKDTNVPDYDAPMGLVGISDLMSSTVRDVTPEDMFKTSSILDRQIVKKLGSMEEFGNLKTAPATGLFASAADQDQADLEVFKRAMQAQDQLAKAYSAHKRSSDYKPPSMEGGETDREILNRIAEELFGPASAEGKDLGGKGDQTVTLDTFSSNVTKYLQNNPGSNNTVANLIGALQSVDRVDNTVLQKVLSAIASGKGFASSLKDEENEKIKLNKNQTTAINAAISALDTEDKDILRELTGGATPEIKSGSGSKKVATSDPLKAPPRPKDSDEAEIWNSIFSITYGPQKGKIMFTPEGEYKGGFSISKSKIKEKIEQYNSAIKQRTNFIDGA